MERFSLELQHVKEKFEERYKKYAAQSDEIINKVFNVLKDHTPDDWRFTESPSSRFFVIEEETEAKFMGMSYRTSLKGRNIVYNIQKNLHNPHMIFQGMEEYVESYISDVCNPALSITHHILTVYPKKKGDIAEERHLFEKTRAEIAHLIPLASKKIASRPNAIVSKDGTLWVRQYLNWVSMRPGSSEYYFFNVLTKDGIDKSRSAIFSYSENGNLRKLPEMSYDDSSPNVSDLKDEIITKARHENFKVESAIRSESYWRVPTYLDHRLLDLTYKEKDCKQTTELNEDLKLSSEELLELYFLREILTKARQRLYK